MTKNDHCQWLPRESFKTWDEEVKTFQVHLSCPVDGCIGEMKFNGTAWSVDPFGYHHTCTECGSIFATQDGKFPKIEHRIIE